MKSNLNVKCKMAKLSAIGLLVAMPVSAIAAATASFNVRGELVATCAFLSTGSVSFTLDPSVGGTINGTVIQPTFWCTKGTIYTISDDSGLHESGTQRRLMNTATTPSYIPYSFTYTNTGTGGGKGATVSMNIGSIVLQSDYINAPEGADYTDTVTLTLTP
jgi:spore coat protein U-like protein